LLDRVPVASFRERIFKGLLDRELLGGSTAAITRAIPSN
jgi:hypothetical protein